MLHFEMDVGCTQRVGVLIRDKLLGPMSGTIQAAYEGIRRRPVTSVTDR